MKSASAFQLDRVLALSVAIMVAGATSGPAIAGPGGPASVPSEQALAQDLQHRQEARAQELGMVVAALEREPDRGSARARELSARRDALERVIGQLENRRSRIDSPAAPESTGPAAPGSSNSFLDGVGKLFGGSSGGNPQGPVSVATGQGPAQGQGGGGFMNMINQVVESQGGWVPLLVGTAAGIGGWYLGGRFFGGSILSKMAFSFAAQWAGSKLAKLGMDWWKNRNGGNTGISMPKIFGNGQQAPPQGDPVQRWSGSGMKLYPGEEQLFQVGGQSLYPTAQASVPAYKAIPSGEVAGGHQSAFPNPPHANPRSVAEASRNVSFWYTQYQSAASGGNPSLVPQMYQQYLVAKGQLNTLASQAR